ncbi:hypothetical protein [Halorhabdus salina]|uniref:hypothetical protein n=1 Tax=Halorhabdus salina TaxID=2750670 RepID=UPI0015EF5ADA|nr:hypothetical protein [Halorhabdus salina]
MAAPPDVVLVYVPDKTKRRSITTALRDRWSVRTAASLDAATTSLDETIAVVVVGGDDSTAIEHALTNSPNECDHIQVLWLGSNEADIAASAVKVLAEDVTAAELQQTVARLHQRARYNRLLTTCYELSRARSEAKADGLSDAVDTHDQTLESVQRELDDLAADIDDIDAFDVALEK